MIKISYDKETFGIRNLAVQALGESTATRPINRRDDLGCLTDELALITRSIRLAFIQMSWLPTLKAMMYRECTVRFNVTSDLGCMRGFHQEEIGSLSEWKSAGGYAAVMDETTGASP